MHRVNVFAIYLLVMCANISAEPTEEVKRIKVIEKCWEKSFAYAEMVEEDETGNSFHDPNYKRKMSNDSECHAMLRAFTKKFGRDLSCRYSRETYGYTCTSK